MPDDFDRALDEDDLLQQVLARRVPERPGGRSAVAEVHRECSPLTSSYTATVITARWESGEELKGFLKDFGTSRFPKDESQPRRDRERGVYRELLAGAGLGTAEYYGSAWDDDRGRFWLLLEFVDGVQVRFCEVETWVLAAGWLGRLNGHFARQSTRLATCDYLSRHDASFFQRRAELARRDVARIAPELSGRLARALDGFDRLVDLLAGQSQTLVHGSYRPCNILAVLSSEPVRICPVDWEAAAVGSALFDLAYLTHGFEPPVLDGLLEAYRREALDHGVAVPELGELRCLVDGFRLAMTVHLLSRSCERGFSARKVARTIDLLDQLHHLVFGRSSCVS